MKRIICLLLAGIMLFSVVAMLASCDGGNNDNTEETKEETEEKSNKVNASLKDVYKAVNEKVPFDEKVSEIIYKEDDTDEMIMMQYGIVEMEAADHLKDYVISMPSDYCNTFAVFVFDKELSADAIAEVKEAVEFNYTNSRASALQMYMPEEYAKMTWALENEDLVWREYDNALAFIITGDKEATDAFEAFEKAALK